MFSYTALFQHLLLFSLLAMKSVVKSASKSTSAKIAIGTSDVITNIAKNAPIIIPSTKKNSEAKIKAMIPVHLLQAQLPLYTRLLSVQPPLLSRRSLQSNIAFTSLKILTLSQYIICEKRAVCYFINSYIAR